MRHFLLIAVLASFAIVADVRAAENELTLFEAVRLAESSAPLMASKEAAVGGARALTESAGRLPDPELVLGVDNWPTTGPDAWSLGNDFMTMRRVGFMQSVPNARKRRSERALAQAQLQAAEADAAATRLTVAQMAATAWVNAYCAELESRNLQSLQSTLALQADAARAGLASGRASASDALMAQAARAELEDRLLMLRETAATARSELVRWAGDAGQSPLAAPPSFASLSVPAEELLASAHHHASLLALDAQIDAARRDVDVASADRRPDWSTELSYARRGPGFSDMVSVAFRVSLPLFPEERHNPAIRAKRAVVTQLESDRATELAMHSAEIRSMLASWQSARDRVELYERERLPLAQQRSRLALAALQSGQSDLRQALAVQVEEIELQRSYADLLRTLGRSWAFLNYLQSPGSTP